MLDYGSVLIIPAAHLVPSTPGAHGKHARLDHVCGGGIQGVQTAPVASGGRRIYTQYIQQGLSTVTCVDAKHLLL